MREKSGKNVDRVEKTHAEQKSYVWKWKEEKNKKELEIPIQAKRK